MGRSRRKEERERIEKTERGGMGWEEDERVEKEKEMEQRYGEREAES